MYKCKECGHRFQEAFAAINFKSLLTMLRGSKRLISLPPNTEFRAKPSVATLKGCAMSRKSRRTRKLPSKWTRPIGAPTTDRPNLNAHHPKCPLMNFEEQITTQNVHMTDSCKPCKSQFSQLFIRTVRAPLFVILLPFDGYTLCIAFGSFPLQYGPLRARE